MFCKVVQERVGARVPLARLQPQQSASKPLTQARKEYRAFAD